MSNLTAINDNKSRINIDAVNKFLIDILQKNITQSNTNWHTMLYPNLWD